MITTSGPAAHAAKRMTLADRGKWRVLAGLAAAIAPALAAADNYPAAVDPDIQAAVSAVSSNRIGSDINTLVNFTTRNTCSSNAGTSFGIGASRTWLRNQFAGLGMQTRINAFALRNSSGGRICPRTSSSTTRDNVIAWFPGTNPSLNSRLIVISGHYDSRTSNGTDGTSPAPGANDSGSQAALLLEVARVLAGRSYDATIVLAAFAAEEQGLYGSSAFTASTGSSSYKNYFPNGIIELNINSDIVGGDRDFNTPAELQVVRVFSPGTPRERFQTTDGTPDDMSPSRGLMRHTAFWSGLYVPSMSVSAELREDRIGRGGDQTSFIKRAIPGIRFIELVENFDRQHSPNDLATFVTPDYTARVAQMVAATAASLARAPTPPRAMTASLSGANVQLSWQVPAAGPAVDHYLVSARSVNDNFYQSRVFVPGGSTSATLNTVNNLNIPAGTAFYVSVAAVDAQGHESLYAYPEYRCTTSLCEVPAGSLDVTAAN